MAFTHLNVQSSFSFLESAIEINNYIHFAKENGHQVLALVDHEVLNGAYQFIQRCQKENIKPLIGMSVDVYIDSEKRPCRFILYAKNFEGYQSLVSITNLIQLENEKLQFNKLLDYKHLIPIVSFYDTFVEELLYLGDDTFVLNLFERLNRHYDHWYINVDPMTAKSDTVHHWLLKQGPRYVSKTILTTEVRYLQESDRIGYESLVAIKNGVDYESIKQQGLKGVHFLSEGELVEKVDPVWHDSLIRTDEIASLCQINFPEKLFGLPKYPLSNGMSSDDYLLELCQKQLPIRYDENTIGQAKERLLHELQIIKNMRFSDYFLIVWDIVHYAKRNDILVGPGRGSAAGSIVAYLLGITEVDPIKYDLLFERFLNPERLSMPDIDIDFSDYRRDEMIKYVANKYGKHHVSQIMTFGTFQARSAIRELSKVFQIEKDQMNVILKHISDRHASLKKIIKENNELQAYIKQSETLKRLFKAAFIIEGLPRHYSTHAAGVVISDESMLSLVPVVTGQDDVMLTQWPMNDLEAVGLLKMDFLGLRNLTFLERMVKSIREKENKRIDLLKLPLDDKKTFQLLQKGFTSGVFQLESEGMKNALRLVRPTELEHIVAVNALFRPGPMQFIETFAKRKNGQEQTEIIHEDLHEIIMPTYGVLVYQEQIMQVVKQMADFSYGQADLLRRAISKKDQVAMTELKEKFIQGCMNNGYEEKLAEEIFNWIEKFANYGFNKSHAVSYSLISYQTAYFKANYPAYFYAELMSQHLHDESKLARYIKEAKSLGIEVLPPSINKSFGQFVVENENEIRFGLLAIKGLGKQAYDEIINSRKNKPFQHLFDFCRRLPLKAVNQSIIESLILAGAFDETKHHRAKLLASVMPAIEQGELFSGLYDELNEPSLDIVATYEEVPPFSMMKQLTMEKEVLGFIISDHPLMQVRRSLQRLGAYSIKEALKRQSKRDETIVCIVQELRHVRTKRGERMAFLTLQDESEEIDAVMFPAVHREAYRWLEEGSLVKIAGRVDRRENKFQIIINAIEPFSIENLPQLTKERLYIKIDNDQEKDYLQALKKMANTYQGGTPIVIYISKQKKTYQLKAEYDLAVDERVIEQLKNIFGDSNVVFRS